MGHWFSQHQENVNTAAVLETETVNYHGPTLAWTIGIIIFVGLCSTLACFIHKYCQNARGNLANSIHRSRDHQRDIELALRAVNQPAAPAPALAQPTAPPAYPAAPLPFVQGVALSVMAPMHIPPYVPGYHDSKY